MMLRTTTLRKTIALLILTCFTLSACAGGASPANPIPATAGGIAVVAAENFYGDIAKQIGGSHVAVTSILSDPNIDPHEYETSVQNALAVTQAQLVIENGAGYDAWMDKLLAASPNPDRTVLVAAELADHKLADNPHYWYGVDNIQTIAKAITAALVKLDGADKASFETSLAAFQASLAPIQQKMDGIKANYAGTPVALTETIFLYQANPLGLRVLTPYDFEKAIAEGNDPPADALVTANDQVARREVKVLIYNQQTVTPITTNLQDAAKKAHIPIVPVTESMPAGKTYQAWMLDQLNALQGALGG
jgi:zinc/manganese transport system substrate-binding protein